jgi:hypothetical protein
MLTRRLAQLLTSSSHVAHFTRSTRTQLHIAPGIVVFLISALVLSVAVSHEPQVTISHNLQKTWLQPTGFGNIAISYTSPILKLDPTAFGMDISGYGAPNVFANDQVEQQKLKMLGIKYMRIDLKYSTPGDPTSKIICAAKGCDTDWEGYQWVQAIKSIGAYPLIIVNYSDVDAANMVKYFNKDTNNYVKYWIIGNEPDQAGISATTYSTYFNHVYDAMKAVDPSIKIGGGATAWYDAPFLQTFLQQSGSRVDFIDFHSYAQEGIAAGDYTTLFQFAAQYGDNINNLRSLLLQYVPDRASQIGIEVGEWDLNWGGTAQSNTNFRTVWTASVLGHILSAGGWSLFYADKGNAIYGSPHTITDSSGHTIGINVDDTGPAYHGIGMFTGEGLFRGFGDTLVSASTTLPDVEVYASDHPKNIVVINKSPSVAQVATVSFKGITSGTIDIWRKDESVLFSSPPIKLGTQPFQDGTFTYQLTPFSVTTFVLNAASQASTKLLPSPPAEFTPTSSPVPKAILAHDTFQRPDQAYWGKASDGHMWGGDANSSQSFSIVGHSGQIANGYNNYNAVLGPAVTNAQVLFSGSINSFQYTNIGAALRWTDANNWYKAYIDGTNLVIQKKVNGSTTILSQTPFTAQAGISYTLRFSVIGSTLSAKVWRTGSPEPDYWMAIAMDNTFSSGYCGLRILIQSGTRSQITAFTAYKLGE